MKSQITTQINRLMLVSVMLLTCLSSFAQANYGRKETRQQIDANLQAAITPWQNAYAPQAEVKEMRSANMKHFRTTDGRFTAFVATGSIHYLNNGKWADIENNIVTNSGNGEAPFYNTTNNFKTYYSSNPFVGGVRVIYNGNTYVEKVKAINFVNEQGKTIEKLAISSKIKSEAVGNQVIYKNVIAGVDLVYTQQNDGKKMELVIYDKAFLNLIPQSATKIVIEEEVSLPHGMRVQKVDNSININNGNEVQVSFPTPLAYETKSSSKLYQTEDELMNEGNIAFTKKGAFVVVKSTFNVNWLKSPARNFPIKLDPTANYGPFAVVNATGRMTTAIAAKQSGFLRLANTNTFSWAKFNIAALGATGINQVDSVHYHGYDYTPTTGNKLSDVRGMANADPVTALNTDIVAQINSGPLYAANYIFAGATASWRSTILDTTLADTALFSSIGRGWFALGMKFTSGATGFAYQAGYDHATPAQICYLQVTYQTAPCSNPVVAGLVTGANSICAGANANLSLVGATAGTGLTYQWQSSPDSTNWTNVNGATNFNFTPQITTDSIYYRCELICSMGQPAYTPAYVVYASMHYVSAINPYTENFESITTANTLPACMAATNLNNFVTTYTAATGNYGQASRPGGTKFASFRWSSNDWIYTRGLKLDMGVTYSTSLWYVTDGYAGWDSLSIFYGTSQTSTAMTRVTGGVVTNATNTAYQQLLGSFVAPASGVYFIGIKCFANGIPYYLSIDDIMVQPAIAPTMATGTKANVTTSAATLNGSILANGGAVITQSGIVVSTSSSPVKGGFGVIDSVTNPHVASGNFSLNVTGLLLATTYYYRAYATNSMGTSYGPDSSFTTNAGAVVPTVLETGPTSIGAYAATIGGNITSDGGSAVTASGVVFATTPTPALLGMGVVDSTTNPVVTTANYSFTLGGLTPSTKYYFRAYATNAIGTAYSLEDSFTTAPVINAFPYFQNFDTLINHGWNAVANGGVNDWVLGTPAKTQITAAYSGNKAWVTGVTASYSNNANAYVVSPQMDLTTFTANALIRFRHNFACEGGWDGGILELSVNNGPWTKVDNTVGTGATFNTATSTGWYNGTVNGGALGNGWQDVSTAYTGNTGGWIQSQAALPGTAGQSNVKVRFRFASDASYTSPPDGWAFDNVEVFAPSAPFVLTGTKANVTTSAADLSGNITGNGGSTVTASGIVLSTSPTPTIAGMGVTDSATNPVVITGSFTKTLTGLFPATTYYYRAYATNAVGTTYGADSTFTTNSSAVLATILETGPTNLGAYSATVGGNITTDGGSPVTVSGVVFATTPNPAHFGMGVVDSITTPVVATGNFSFSLGGLIPSTKYYYRAYAINGIGTAYSIQDSFTTAPVVTGFPYFQNFDTLVNHGWNSVANGGVNDWVLGTPAKAQITAAYSGTKAWVTGVTASYSNNANAYVVSPQMDLSTFTANALIRFRHNFATESGWDGGILELSVNNGPWTKVDNTVGTGATFNTATSKGWYNGNINGGGLGNGWRGVSTAYAGHTGGWIQSQAALPGTAGQSNVKVRFRFASDASYTTPPDGWAFDDVEVFAPSAPIMLTGAKANVTTSLADLSGTIISDGGSTVTVSGIVLSASPTPTVGGFGVTDSATNPIVLSGAFTKSFSGLFPGTTYYYRSYATNAIGTSYGADSIFVTNTSAIAPTVLETGASTVTATTATIGGNITSDGGATVTASGVVFSTTSNPALFGVGVVDSTTTPLVTTGNYSFVAAGLLPNTKYYFRAYASNSAGTGYSVQDSFMTAPIINIFPYFQNFDTVLSQGGWSSVANGGVNDWVLGTPAKAQITAAYSGTKAWVTGAGTSTYSNSANAYVVSPQFDFTALATNPIIRFRHNFACESGWDGGIVEISVNNGPWNKLDNNVGTATAYNTANSAAWYNGNINGAALGNGWRGVSTDYAGHTGGWIQSQTTLTGAAGQSNVKVRFRFASDVSYITPPDGWAIDDIEVEHVTVPTVPASNVNITPANTTASVSFTNGNGRGRMVVARLTTTTAVAPTNNTLYNANAAFGGVNTTGTGNYIVYMGNGSTVNVTNLAQLTNYTFDVYEYNGKFMHIAFAAAASNNATTLPVTMLSFNAENRNGDVKLNWSTASEKNNSGFNIERSIDGNTFEYVKFVKGAINSSVVLSYSAVDEKAFVNAASNKLYYRLQQVDIDGKYTYSKIAEVSYNIVATSFNVSAYPMPFDKWFNVAIQSPDGGLTELTVTDLQGRVVAKQQINAVSGVTSYSIRDIENVEAGVYFLQVKQGSNNINIKVVKQ